MPNDHWFDKLNKLIVERASRRGVLLTTLATITGLIVGAESDVEAAPNRNKNKKRNKNRNRKKNKKRNKKPRRQPKPSPPTPTCSAGVCQNQWSTPERAADAASCEITCERCKRTDTELCILEGDPNNPEKFADCCGPCEFCVGGQCLSGCASNMDCCDGSCCPDGQCCQSTLGSVCAPAGAICCPEAPNGWCPAGQECCAGVGCSAEPCDCADSPDPCCNDPCNEETHCCPHPGFTGIQCVQLDFDRDNCGSCGNQCPPYPWGCCKGECVDLSSDPRYCGACNWHCQPGQTCVDRFCRWPG